MKECRHFVESLEKYGSCSCAKEIIESTSQPSVADVPTSKEACDACLRSDPVFDVNRVTVSLAISAVAKERGDVSMLLDKYGPLLERRTTRLPPILQKAFSVSRALAEFGKNPVFVEQDVYDARLKECESCPSRSDHRCTICGCYIIFKTKLPKSRCPVYRWESVE